MESVYEFMDSQSEEIIGHDNKRYLSYLITLGLFILCCNLIGLIPFFETPTGVPVVPLGCAVVTWFFYQMHGIRANGLGYIKHFMGPVWWLAPLMFLIEVCSHLARMMSLTIRLFANMFAGDMVTLVFFSLMPIGMPVIFLVAAFRCFADSDVHFRAAGDGVPGRGYGARALDRQATAAVTEAAGER